MFKQLLTAFNTLSSPAGKKQASYKEQAKAKKLLSILELSKQLEEGTLNITELQADEKFKTFSDPIKLDSSILSEADEKGKVKLSNVTIFTEKNFHNLHILEDGYRFLAENQAQFVDENPDFACVNPNHTGDLPEQSFGEFTITEMNFEKGEIKADIELDINHPAFATQKYALEQDPELQLGFSIEVGAVDGGFAYDIKEKAFLYSKPVIAGLATTLIPSAPGTLMNLDNQNLAVAEPAENVEDEMVEAGDYVLNAKKEMNCIASIIRDTSFVYQDITCSESDPVALLYNPGYWDWDEEDGNYSFANVSTLIKVHYNSEPNQLSVLKEKINISMAKLKEELKIESLEVESKPEIVPEEKPVVSEPEVNSNLTLDSLKVEYEAKLQAQVDELTTKFMKKVDEIDNKFKTELAQVRADQETSFDMVIKTLTSQNETLSAQNSSIRNLEKFNQPKPITTF